MIEKLLAAVRAVLKTEVTPDTSTENTPQWDSLRHIELIFAVEDACAVQFDKDELADLTSVASLIAAVQRRHPA